jgi:hypothetical protein
MRQHFYVTSYESKGDVNRFVARQIHAPLDAWTLGF